MIYTYIYTCVREIIRCRSSNHCGGEVVQYKLPSDPGKCINYCTCVIYITVVKAGVVLQYAFDPEERVLSGGSWVMTT